jgi:alpha-methylacyl-CoA racemase
MGPLEGRRIVEMAGIGPAPFCAMLLADMGAEVVRIDRPGGVPAIRRAMSDPVLERGKTRVELDLKRADGVDAALRLIDRADTLIEGYRPGVMERLGLGPDVCCARNRRLVYGRMTGWGQHGPLAHAAGHDINYIALSGALHAIGPADQPLPPLNLVGDFGGGAMLLAFGIVCAMLDAQRSGEGQVIDAAMSDGSALLMAMVHGFRATGRWKDRRGANFLDGAAHFYGTYRCADGRWLAVGAIEPQFYSALLEHCGIDDPLFERQWDEKAWPVLREKLAAVLATRSRDEWCALFDGIDGCVAPVLSLEEAPRHAHNVARGTFFSQDGVVQPAPAPRFSRTALDAAPRALASSDIADVLAAWENSPT